MEGALPRPRRKGKVADLRPQVDAERWLGAEQADIAQGRWVDPRLGRTTFAEYVPT